MVSQRLLVEPGAVLLHLDTTATFGINEVGSFIWDLMEEPLTVRRLRDRVAEGLTDPPATLETDLHQFLHLLAARGLIVLDPPLDDVADSLHTPSGPG